MDLRARQPQLIVTKSDGRHGHRKDADLPLLDLDMSMKLSAFETLDICRTGPAMFAHLSNQPYLSIRLGARVRAKSCWIGRDVWEKS